MGWFSKRRKVADSDQATSSPEVSGPSFKARVEAFWQWYPDVATRFFQTIEDGNCGDLQPEVSEKVDELLPGLAWVFGPGEDGNGHSLTLSGEGVEPKFLLTEFWKKQAPSIEGWTFYDARPPGNTEGAIRIGENTFEASAIWLTPSLDEEEEKVDIAVWHPLFDALDENQRYTVLFLWLDESLGERGTMQWIGRIEFSDQQLKNAIPLSELREFTLELKANRKWHEQEQIGVVYQLEPREGPLRADSYVGSTACYPVIQDYLESFTPPSTDPVEGLGADFVFLSVDGRNFPEDDPLTFRSKIEEEVGTALEDSNSGQVLGGALGITNGYIDLLLYDGETSIALVEEAVRNMNLSHPVAIHPFYESFGVSRFV